MFGIVTARHTRAAVLTLLALLAGVPGMATAQPVEVLSITPALVAAAKKEGKVYFRYSAQPPAIQSIANAFKAQYGIEVILDRKVGPVGTNSFLTEERAGRHFVDVQATSDVPGIPGIIKEGFYKRIALANANQFPAEMIVKDYGFAPFLTSMILVYNSDTLKPADAKRLFHRNWNGLLDKRFDNGRIGLVDVQISSISGYWYWALKTNPKYGDAFMQKVAALKPIIYDGAASAREGLLAGDIDLILGDSMSSNLTNFGKGAPVAWVYPDILPSYASIYFFLSANAPNANAARLFITWMGSVDGAKAIFNSQTEPSINVKLGLITDAEKKAQATSWYEPYPDSVRWRINYQQALEVGPKYREEVPKIFKGQARK